MPARLGGHSSQERRDRRRPAIIVPISPSLPSASRAYAGVFLVVDSDCDRRQVIGQLRDDAAAIDNPGKIGPFGGSIEPSEEPRHAAWRELVQEETNLRLDPSDLRLMKQDVAWRSLTEEWEHRHLFFACIPAGALATLEVYEGRGWARIAGADDPRLIESYRPMVATLLRISDADTG